MPRPTFSEILYTRRQELGVTITQAARVLKIKEQMLAALEEGDFRHIPKSGYAQAMLSSYASYLGLNPRAIVDQYAKDIRQSSSPNEEPNQGRRKKTASRTYETQSNMREASSVAPEPHAFDSTSQVRTRSDSWYSDRSAPLVNPRSVGTTRSSYQGNRYTQNASSPTTQDPYHPQAYGVRNLRGGTQIGTPQDPNRTLQTNPVEQQRRYTNRLPQQTQDTRSGYMRPTQRRQQEGPYAPSIHESSSNNPYSTGSIYTRDVPSYYQNDMRLEDEPSVYEVASTTMGRRSSRNIASTERPYNLQRGSRDTERHKLKRRGATQQQYQPGIVGMFQRFFSDPRRAIFVVLLALVVVLTLIIIFSVRSCAASHGVSSTVAVTEVTSSSSQSSSSSDDAADTDDDASTDSGDTQTTDDASESDEATETTTVVVSIGESDVSWLEIRCDGESVVAETLTGPWEQSFEVSESITIQSNNPNLVSVTQDGEAVPFTTSSSGLGSITITPS